MTIRKFWFAAVILVGIRILMGCSYFGLATQAAEQDTPNAQRSPKDVLARAEPVVEKRAIQEEKKAVSVKELPPVVVRTVPQSGDTQVDTDKVKEIRVTFSKDMMDESWSWAQISDETFPKTDGKIHYEKDRRTCVLPVKLEAGKTYVLWLNSERFVNFKDTDGRSAVPYLLVFETKPKE